MRGNQKNRKKPMYSIENYKDYTVYALHGISLRGFERTCLLICL